MNIIIAGCGKVGCALAEQLNAEGHEISVIDTDPQVVQRQRRAMPYTAPWMK